MKSEFRIKENEEGFFEVYYVESKGNSFFTEGKELLKPYITWSGYDNAYPFSTLENAIEELKQEVIKNTKRFK